MHPHSGFHGNLAWGQPRGIENAGLYGAPRDVSCKGLSASTPAGGSDVKRQITIERRKKTTAHAGAVGHPL